MSEGQKIEKIPQGEWTMILETDDRRIRTIAGKGGKLEALGEVKTLIDIGGGKIVEVSITGRNSSYGERPEEIVISRQGHPEKVVKFIFVQTDEDRITDARPFYYSLQDPKGKILQSSRGEYADYALAVSLLGEKLPDGHKIEDELKSKAGYPPSSSYIYNPETIKAIKEAAAKLEETE